MPVLTKVAYRSRLAAMRATGGNAATLAAALTAARRQEREPWMDRVERRRSDLLASTDAVGVGDDRPLGVAAKAASKGEPWCLVLAHLAAQFRCRRALELGAAFGISGSYIAHSLSSGHLATIEGRAPIAARARETYGAVGASNVTVEVGWFDDILPGLLPKLAPLDFVFVDGNHDGEATLRYEELIRPYLAADAVMVFDDIDYNDGMRDAWRTLREDATTSIETGPLGIAVGHRFS